MHVWVGKWVLTVVCAYVQNNSSVFPVLLESLGECVKVPLGIQLSWWGTSVLTWAITTPRGM